MLDTNIASDLIRNPAGRIATRLAQRGDQDVCISIFTAAELRFGGEKSGSDRLKAQIETVLAGIDIIPFGSPGDIHYARLRRILEAAGTPIGPNDTWIAAHALALGVTLITHNLAEFRRVPGLSVESWLE